MNPAAIPDSQTALQPLIIPAGTPTGPLASLALASAPLSELRRAIEGLPFNTIYDYLRTGARQMIDSGDTRRAIESIEALDETLTRAGDPDRMSLDIHAAMMQVLVGLRASEDDSDAALSAAATAMSLLAQEPKRKDEPFLAVLASLLYDMGLIYHSRSEFKHAERSLDKSARIFGRLARTNPDRYGPAHVVALDAAAKVCRKAGAQAEALKECQEATSRYLSETRDGAMDDAVERLADSMVEQGLTLAKMGRHREAIQYLSRALRYLTRLHPEMDLRQLNLSTELGFCLLHHKPTREKGIHLLNTMLHKATRLGDAALHRRIVDVLAEARTPGRLDILGVWHKIFPR